MGVATGLKDAAGTRLFITGTIVDGEFLKRSGTTLVSQAGGGGYTYEQAQDTVGAMADAESLVYTDSIPLLAAKVQMSVTKDASGLKLSGDAASPGNNQVYGTDGAGVKGWKADPAAAAHDLGGASHNADTLANLNAKISDADVVAFAGQIGGSAASPDIRGIRETGGPTLLTLGAVTDGQYLVRSGTTLIGGSPGGGSNPAWYGKLLGCMGNGNPNDLLRNMLHNPIHATPTNITVSVARCAFFRPAANITVNTIRFFGVGATTGVYHVAIYRHSDLTRLTADLSPNTAAQTWGTAATSLGLALTAGALYFIAVSVDTTGTTAGMHCLSATTGRIGVLPPSWPGNLDIDLATPIIDPVAFCQFAVSTGALPNPAATLALQAAWTGGMPAIFLDNA